MNETKYKDFLEAQAKMTSRPDPRRILFSTSVRTPEIYIGPPPAPSPRLSNLEIKRRNALEYLGERWVLHPNYKGHSPINLSIARLKDD